MDRKTWLEKLGEVIDAQDPDGLANYLTEDGIFRFGNQPELHGRKELSDSMVQFYATVESTKHELINFWESGNTVIWQGRVTYTRLDAKKVAIDFCNLLTMKDDLIARYLIYIDVTPLFA